MKANTERFGGEAPGQRSDDIRAPQEICFRGTVHVDAQGRKSGSGYARLCSSTYKKMNLSLKWFSIL
jgi:hypothetical protein